MKAKPMIFPPRTFMNLIKSLDKLKSDKKYFGYE